MAYFDETSIQKIKRRQQFDDYEDMRFKQKPKITREVVERRIFMIHTGDKHSKVANCSKDKIYFNCSCGAKEAMFLRPVR